MNKNIIILLFFTGILFSCVRVPVTGRRQLNLVPNALIQSMAFVEYDSFLTVTKVLPASNLQTQMVRNVGTRIQHAVEEYMHENGFSKQIKNFKWEFNLIDENVVNAWCMPGGKVVVYTGILPVTQNETALAVVNTIRWTCFGGSIERKKTGNSTALFIIICSRIPTCFSVTKQPHAGIRS
jgi:Zn-dependent protease with chaperone function